MKLKLGFVALGLALLVGLPGCANQDDDIIPAKRPGFRPPSTPLVQDDLPPVDPLAGAGTESSEGNPSPDAGFQPPSNTQVRSSAVVTNPAPQNPPQGSGGQPDAGVKTEAPQPPKPAEVPYAKRSPKNRNYILSPYDGTLLDATGFLPGEEVRDPKSGKMMKVP